MYTNRSPGTFGPDARVRDHNGSPALFVNDEPIPPMTYTGNPTRPGYVRGLADAGIRVYFVTCGLDWFQPDRFDDLRTRATFILQNHPEAWLILRTSLHPPVQWLEDNPDELVRYDHDATWYAGQRIHVDLCHMMRDLEIHRIGAPVAYHFHDDLALENMPDYRLYLFLNTFVLTDSERLAIDQKVKARGQTAFWIYAPGIINPGAQPRFSLDHLARLTGMKAAMESGPASPECHVLPGTGDLLPGVASDRDYGLFDRPMFGDVANVQPPGPAWTGRLYPYLYGNDPLATVLARFRADGQPALVSRDFGDWRSIHAFFQAVRSDILRAVARTAGCHIYCDSDDILYANPHFVTLHASSEGKKTIHLPHASDPFEIYERRAYGVGARRIGLTLAKGETRTFHLNGEI